MNPAAVDLAPFGLAVGHATDVDGATGCTVVRGVDRPLRAAAAVVGRATGTRELAALDQDDAHARLGKVEGSGGSHDAAAYDDDITGLREAHSRKSGSKGSSATSICAFWSLPL